MLAISIHFLSYRAVIPIHGLRLMIRKDLVFTDTLGSTAHSRALVGSLRALKTLRRRSRAQRRSNHMGKEAPEFIPAILSGIAQLDAMWGAFICPPPQYAFRY